jgi:hypothetical protein
VAGQAPRPRTARKALGAPIPAVDAAFGVEGINGVVMQRLDHGSKALLVPAATTRGSSTTVTIVIATAICRGRSATPVTSAGALLKCTAHIAV